MEIVNINPYALGIKGGVEVHLSYLTERLQRLGHNVVNIAGAGNADKFEQYNQSRDEFFSPSSPPDDLSEESKYQLVDADEIHLHNLHTLGSEKNLILNRFLHKNLLTNNLYLHIHNFNNTESEITSIESFNSTRLIVYSEFMQQTVLSLCGKQATIGEYFFPLKQPTEKSNGNNTVRIIQPTRFNRMKGSHHSLAVVSTLINEGHDIQFIHGGFNLTKAKILMEETLDTVPIHDQLSMQRSVENGSIILGSYNYEEILDLINSSDIVLLPTTTYGPSGEPFGIAAFQSITLNKFIIASDSGNYSSLFNANNYAHSVSIQAGSKTQLFNALLDAVNNGNFTISDLVKNWTKQYVDTYLEKREKYLAKYKQNG
jgi:glycosyltransferase involved in cell wall biosynthesis